MHNVSRVMRAALAEVWLPPEAVASGYGHMHNAAKLVTQPTSTSVADVMQMFPAAARNAARRPAASVLRCRCAVMKLRLRLCSPGSMACAGAAPVKEGRTETTNRQRHASMCGKAAIRLASMWTLREQFHVSKMAQPHDAFSPARCALDCCTAALLHPAMLHCILELALGLDRTPLQPERV